MGVPLGVDVCYTNHAEADQDDMDTLLTLLAAAGVTYVMGVPGADDVMLNYQIDVVPRRALCARGVRPASARPSSRLGCSACGSRATDARLRAGARLAIR